MGTQVPAGVKEHYVTAARRRGVSLSVYFEMLSKVDPLATAPIEDAEQQGPENT